MRIVPMLAVLLCCTSQASARGLLIPEEKSLPPLAMLNHKVSIAIDDQVATTRVEQTFRNHTARQLEATYIFPVPRGASVNKFTMWVDGKEMKGELVEAKQAREIYNSIVRRTQDPGLLEYIGANLFRMSVFPIPPSGDQKVSLSFTCVVPGEGGLVEYLYPLKGEGKAAATLEDFSVTATITSQHGIENVYSPTHAVTLQRRSDKQVDISFSQKQATLDRDFQLFYQFGTRDVGLTALTHRPIAAEDGHFLMLISPQLKMSKEQKMPRDIVMVLDTSGSMAGIKMEQARKALKFFLDRLDPADRFGLINFATSVDRYREKLTEAGADHVKQAKKWVDELEATGGTNISDALKTALDMRPADEGRTFTIVFFTDGCPTVGETDPEAILKTTMARNTASTRIFTFGVGDDVNATLLDRLADRTRAWASYVRPAEDIEAKVSNLHVKIAHPVLSNLKIASTADVKLKEIYPPQLPDLFHGSQLIVLGRYTGKGPSAIKLTGKVGKIEKEFVYEITFPEKTGDERQLVEHLWARRKVGYLLNEIRVNGQQKELVEEVTKLARRHGIATPYTSYLLVPDGPVAIKAYGNRVSTGVPDVRFHAPFPMVPPANLMGGIGGGGQMIGGIGGVDPKAGGIGGKPTGSRQFGMGGAGGQFGALGGPPPGRVSPKTETKPVASAPQPSEPTKVLDFAQTVRQAGFDGKNFVPLPSEGDKMARDDARRKLDIYLRAGDAIAKGKNELLQSGELGVDLSLEVDKLRQQQLLSLTGQRSAAGHEFQLLGGSWIDRDFKEKMPAVVVKAQSEAYFRILERRPEAKDVLRMGNRLVWVTPSGTALVVDPADGKTALSDKAIDALFVEAKK